MASQRLLQLKHAKYEKDFKAYLKTRNIRLVKYSVTTASMQCNVCSAEWNARPSNVLRLKSGCKKCYLVNAQKLKAIEAGKKYVRVVCKNRKVLLLEPYVNALTPVLHKCLVCDNEWKVKPNDVSNAPEGFNRCLSCASKQTSIRSRTPVKKLVEKIHSIGKVEVIKVYKRRINEKAKAKVRCLKCSFVFKPSVPDLINSESGCPVCHKDKNLRVHRSVKNYELGGRRIQVHGYEPLAIDLLLKRGYKPENIKTGIGNREVPIIKYYFDGSNRRYFPDIYLPEDNLLIEIKSVFTLGLKKGSEFRIVREKARASITKGFKFKLMAFSTKKKRLRMPSNWWELSYKKFCREFFRVNGNPDVIDYVKRKDVC